MTVDPRYNFLPGTEITLAERPAVVTGQSDHGYILVGLEDGATTVVPFGKLIELLNLPGTTIDTSLPATGGRTKQRLGGYTTSQALSEEQRELGRFHLALCQAMHAYRSNLRVERGEPEFELSERKADTRNARRFIAEVGGNIFGQKILTKNERGGPSSGIYLYRGRTLMKYFKIYEGLEPDESPIDALVTLDHLKGNRTSRLSDRLREMMTEAWEHIGLDTKCSFVSNVYKYLEARIWEENIRRVRNELPKLVVPSHKTLSEHRDRLLTPAEQMIATKGLRYARNKRGRGSTDLRALLIGEVVEIDECKISLVSSAKAAGFWERMSRGEREALEKHDEYIKARFWIVVMLDVATRMPLAWLIAEAPSIEATLALFRMATRDKSREKRLYGCSGEPAAPVGLMHVKNDNGSGLRNSTSVGALMGMGTINSVARTYSSTDRAVIERFFGTLEMDVFKLLPGYTGGRPGELPGYDAMANGVLTVEQLHEIVTRYFIDEYPSVRHYGADTGGRRPADVYKTINETRGQIPPIDPNVRRINLGWEEEVTPTDEGVRVFQGIWFNSDKLQQKREWHKGKVRVFIDPDDVNFATVILPKVKEPIEVQLQITAFADMTLPEILRLMAEHRREDTAAAEFHEDQVMRTRLRRYDQIQAIGVEHNLPRSYSTIAECRAMARAVFAGARVIHTRPQSGTIRPGAITELRPADGVFQIGGDDPLTEGTAEMLHSTDVLENAALELFERGAPAESDVPKDAQSPVTTPPTGRSRRKPANSTGALARPRNLKGLE